MIVLEKLEDLEKYYNAEENSYKFQESIQIKFDLKIKAGLIVKGNIYARGIYARGIYARDIYSGNIYSGNIDARDIYAENIYSGNIYSGNIYARGIYAKNIKYYAFAVAYRSFKCVSITGIRENSIALCLDQPIFYKDKENK